MTDKNTLSRALASNLAQLFAEHPAVEAVALGGSHSAFASDAQSDIDLYVYTRAEITLAERQSMIERAGGATRANIGMDFWGPGDEWFHRVTGIEIDSMYFDCAWMEGQIARVLDEHQASMGYSTCFWRTVRQSQPLFDRNGWFRGLQQRSRAEYPPELQRNIIALNHPVLRNVIPSYFQQIAKAVQRQDRVSVNHRVAALLASYFDVIFAVNRVLHPGEKRLLAFAAAECHTLPLEMAADLHAVLDGGPDIVARITTLLDQLDDLLEREGFDHRAWT
ncbi:hypothetical protein SE17_06195 [Kouleothrix aurantiaca]|uniref:Uncharacterized protein n=1 Tax=Kouleothrix aurantiaca TaxID=186479 RepID=A0A0P9FLF3_9CHLR|nr:hypothetical protein SE17_06195 [Kouleothrix aurantiaca]